MKVLLQKPIEVNNEAILKFLSDISLPDTKENRQLAACHLAKDSALDSLNGEHWQENFYFNKNGN